MKKVTVYKGDLNDYNQFKRDLKGWLGSKSNAQLNKMLERMGEAPQVWRHQKIKAAGALLRAAWHCHRRNNGGECLTLDGLLTVLLQRHLRQDSKQHAPEVEAAPVVVQVEAAPVVVQVEAAPEIVEPKAKRTRKPKTVNCDNCAGTGLVDPFPEGSGFAAPPMACPECKPKRTRKPKVTVPTIPID